MKRPARRRWTVAAFLALMVAATGCELQRDPTGLELERAALGVHSVLIAGEDSARVLVVRFSRDVPVQDAGIVPVEDADVRLVRNAEETRLTPGDVEACVGERSIHLVQPGRGCYAAALPRAVAPGDRFELTVRLADGEVVRGSAVIPGAAVVRSPSAGDTVRITRSRTTMSLGSLPLELQPPPGGALLELGVRTSREPACRAGLSLPEGGFPLHSQTVRIAPDDASGLSLTVGATCWTEEGGFEPVGELPARLLALAYDTAYARWIELAVDGQNLPVHGASAGLTGAVGYFAGASRVAVPLLIVEE